MKHSLREDLTVIDFGAHFFPEEVREHLTDSTRSGGSGSDEYAGRDRMHDPETRVQELRDAGVDAMVISIPSFMGTDDADVATETNDVLLETVESYDEFYGLASLPVGAGGEASAAEFERCIDAGFNGVGLDETHHYLTDDEMEPVLEKADQTGAPVFVHVPTMPYIDLRFNATFGRERELQESISRAIHRGVFDRYPDAKIVWHHMGGNIAAMLGRVHLHAKPGHWPLQEEMKSFTEYKDTLEENVYIDTAGYFGWSAPLRIALEEFPSSQILLGSDAPGEPHTAAELEKFADTVMESGTRTDAKNILGQNALDIMVNVN